MYGALDIGGTKITIGLVENHQVLCSSTLPTGAGEGPEAAVERCAGALDELCVRAGSGEISALGIGCAGPVNPGSGVIENPYSLPGWDRVSFTAEMHKRLGVPVFIGHDVSTILTGQVQLGKLQDHCVVLAMFGTGVGISVYRDGGLFENASGHAPELGSFILRPRGELCPCGRRGCMESLLSGPALHKRARRLGFPDFGSLLQSSGGQAEALRREVAEELEMLADTFGLLFHMDLLYFGGGITQSHPGFFESALSAPFQKSYAYTPDCRIMRIREGEAALIGAALLCEREAS